MLGLPSFLQCHSSFALLLPVNGVLSQLLLPTVLLKIDYKAVAVFLIVFLKVFFYGHDNGKIQFGTSCCSV